MSKPRTLALTALCLGLLAVTAIASPAAAKDGDEDRSGQNRGPHDAEARAEEREERRELRNEARENRSLAREDRQERMRAAHDAWQACKRENATANQSMQERCGDEKAYFLDATKARREGAVLQGAIAALERRIGRLEAREIALEQELGNESLAANETAQIEARIAKIDAHQERMAERLEALKARLEERRAQWHEVMDAAADDADAQDDESEESASESDSGSGSES